MIPMLPGRELTLYGAIGEAFWFMLASLEVTDVQST